MEQSDLKNIGTRLQTMRDILDITVEEMAEITGTSREFYTACERGETDIPISFLYKCAHHLGLDVTDLIMGETPRLSVYQVVKKNEGIPVERRRGFSYKNMSYLFKGRKVEPFMVTAPYSDEAQHAPIPLSVHEGQEFDMVVKGSLRMVVDGKTELLEEGDCIYLDSSHPHGMIAAGGEDCSFLAVVIPGDDAK